MTRHLPELISTRPPARRRPPIPAVIEDGAIPDGMVEFLIFGFRHPDGTVELVASRDLPEGVTIETTRSLRYGIPYGTILTARLDGYAITRGDDLHSALRALGDYWSQS